MLRFPLFLFLLAAVPAAAQVEPGWGYTWETVGEAPINARAFVVDTDGTLWASAPTAVRWLDLTNGSPGRWQPVTYFWPGEKPDAMISLGPDSLIGAGGGVKMTTDGGATWPEVWDEGEYAIYEVPPGHPAAGRVLVGTSTGGLATGAGYSDDRGANWAFATMTMTASSPVARAFAAVPPGTAPGAPARVVAGGNGGAWLSDDGGASWRASSVFIYPRYQGQQAAAFPRAGGGTRALVLIDDTQSAAIRPFYSDDGGETWQEGTGLVEPSGDGLGWPNTEGFVPLGGSSALAVLGRGRIWRTEDGGATWTEVAQTPRLNATTLPNAAVLGADGRLYVGMTNSGSGGWVYRTAEAVVPTTAPEPPPADGTGLRLGVVPNPATGAVTLSLVLPEPGPVRLAVYDGLGREVAVLLDGPQGAGPHAVAFDGSALPPGAYLVRASAGAATATAPLTLAR